MPLPCFDTEHIAKMYEARKNTRGNHADRGADGKYLRAQNGPLGEKKRIYDQIAEEVGVGCHAARGSDGRYLSDTFYHLGV